MNTNLPLPECSVNSEDYQHAQQEIQLLTQKNVQLIDLLEKVKSEVYQYAEGFDVLWAEVNAAIGYNPALD